MLQPLYTAGELRAAEEGHDVGELMERAGRAVADEVLRRYPDARRIVGVCGGGANGGDGRIALRVLREAGRDAEEGDDLDGADVVLDALFGTGFEGKPRPDAAERNRADQRRGRAGRRGRPAVWRRRFDGRGRRAPLSSRTAR